MDTLAKKAMDSWRKAGPREFVLAVRMYITQHVKQSAIHPFIVRSAISQIQQFEAQTLEEVFDWATTANMELLRPRQDRDEFLSVLRLLQERRAKTILEIGTSGGGSLFCFSRAMPDDALLVSVDLPRGYPRYRRRLYESFARARQQLHLVLADSHADATRDRVKEIFAGRPVDFLFIDGDHRYEGVKRDFELYSPLVAPGGIVGMHDINSGDQLCDGGARVYWQEIRDRYPHQEFITHPDAPYCGIGVLTV